MWRQWKRRKNGRGWNNYTKVALKYLKGLPKNLQDNIRNAVKGLTGTPPTGDIKVMQGFSDGRRRLRVGKYRVIYRYTEEVQKEESENKTIEILLVMDIGSRDDIYK